MNTRDQRPSKTSGALEQEIENRTLILDKEFEEVIRLRNDSIKKSKLYGMCFYMFYLISLVKILEGYSEELPHNCEETGRCFF